jgi:hypothetical protein
MHLWRGRADSGLFMQAIVSWRANTFLRQADEERITQPQAVAPDASMAPTVDWLCVPIGRNDQLIYVALARGPSPE